MSNKSQTKLSRIKRNLPILRTLKTCNIKLRKSILKTCEQDTIKALLELAINVLNGNLQISSVHKQKLQSYKNKIRKLASRKTNFKVKRKILIQEGKGVLIPTLISSLLMSAVGKLLEKKS